MIYKSDVVMALECKINRNTPGSNCIGCKYFRKDEFCDLPYCDFPNIIKDACRLLKAHSMVEEGIA